MQISSGFPRPGAYNGPEARHLGEFVERFIVNTPTAAADAPLDRSVEIFSQGDGVYQQRAGGSREPILEGAKYGLLPTVAVSEDGRAAMLQNQVGGTCQIFTMSTSPLGFPPRVLFNADKPLDAIDVHAWRSSRSSEDDEVPTLALVSGSHVETWRLEVTSSQREQSLDFEHPITAARYLLDGSLALRGHDGGGQARYYFVEPATRHNPHPQLFELQLDPSGSLLASQLRSQGARTPIRVWDVAAGRELSPAEQSQSAHRDWIASLVTQRLTPSAPGKQPDPNARITPSPDGGFIQIGDLKVPVRPGR
jgi:hypothetical protein